MATLPGLFVDTTSTFRLVEKCVNGVTAAGRTQYPTPILARRKRPGLTYSDTSLRRCNKSGGSMSRMARIWRRCASMAPASYHRESQGWSAWRRGPYPQFEHGSHRADGSSEKNSGDRLASRRNSLVISMNLPPGWRLFALFGADWVRGTGLRRVLLDLFCCLFSPWRCSDCGASWQVSSHSCIRACLS